jgi:hypothetical protein
MKDEKNEVLVLDQSIEVVEKGQRFALESIHENMGELIKQANEISISIDDKEQYEKAVELKRVIKATHVAIDKKTKELKAPILEMSRRLSDFSLSLYNPLKKAEAQVKTKMEAYENEQERLKLAKKQEQENIAKKAEELDKKLHSLNSYLGKINNAKTIADLDEIEIALDSQKLSEYGERSDEAGFIITNLKMTCKMAKKAMSVKDSEPIPVAEKKVEPIPVAEKKVEPIPVAQKKVEPIPVAQKKVEPIPVAEKKIEPIQTKLSDGELDFGALADIQSSSKVNDDKTSIEDCRERDVIETHMLLLLEKLGANLTDMNVYRLAQEHVDLLFHELFVHNDQLLVTKS